MEEEYPTSLLELVGVEQITLAFSIMKLGK
jgi:hypothetical protein